ncbi:MAG: 30S ribosomal protein S2 [Chloroflexi bacterium]|nr:30S ribosomal protein S2 [Chloroflexota bacterium]
MASVVSMKALLESGVHFGHRTNKWNPRMRPYIFTERNGIHIIDLQQTVKSLGVAYNLVRDTVSEGGSILLVGTKRQAQETIKEDALRAGMPYVTERWLGGMLTNWVTMYARIKELERLEQMRDSGEINRLTKKEGLLITREINRLEIRLSGVRFMTNLPDLIFVVDVAREATAVHEANLTNIPVIALVDTNCDPRGVDYVIPSNDDAIRAIKLLVGKMADAVLEGKAMRKEEFEEEKVEAAGSTVVQMRPRMEAETELEDKDLLGEATLAKLSPAKFVEVEDESEPETETETNLDIDSEDIPEA